MLLVTGASGFVGRALCAQARARGMALRPVMRRPVGAGSGMDAQQGVFWVSELAANTHWRGALEGVHAVVHLAARVHVMRERALDPLAEFRRVNVDATLQLARQSAAAGVRRFVYVSSVKVMGEHTEPGHAFGAHDVPQPEDAYGQSKLEAEQGLQRVAQSTGLEVCIVRAPLVYGPGVKANFAMLQRAVAQGWPLPLGSIRNLRSLVALDNLTDLLLVCATHPAAANQTLMVSDGEDVSTPELLRRMALAQGTRARVFETPLWLLRAGAAMTGQMDMLQRLIANLQVDISATTRLLQWTPPISLQEGLRRSALPISP